MMLSKPSASFMTTSATASASASASATATTTTIESSSQSLIPFLAFTTSACAYTLFKLKWKQHQQVRVRVLLVKDDKKKKKNTNNHDTTTTKTTCRPTAIKNTILSYDKVLQLRDKYYSKSVSVSYSNSGPLMIVGGTNSFLIDHTGKHYLDTRNNVAHVGHQNPHVIHAITTQLSTLNTNSRYLHPNSVLLAQRLLLNHCPAPLAKVFFVNSGSEANDLALRLARVYSGGCKNSIMVENGYHGHTLGTLEVSPYKFSKSKEYESLLSEKANGMKTPGDHLYQVPCPDVYRGRDFDHTVEKARDSRDSYDYAKDVEAACQHFQQKGEQVSAFIIEGGMSVGGVILPKPSYLKRCAKAVRDAGGLYIADEVQTGFGRLGCCYWAFQYNGSDVVPDIVTVGKPFGNGMALAAVITTQEVVEAFESMNVEYFNTFGGNPVACAAGLAVLDEIENKQLQKHANEVGNYLRSKFEALKENLHIIGDVRGSGLFIGIDLVTNQLTRKPASIECSFICTILKEKYDILTSIDGPFDNVLVVKPPLCFTIENADVFVSAFERAVVDDLAVANLGSISKTPT